MIHKTKINFRRIAERIERLKDIIQRVKGIELIIAFGRLLTGRRWPRSNVDLAFQVAGLDDAKRSRIYEVTCKALGIKDVDFAFLNDDFAYRLKYHIAWKGRLLYEAREGMHFDFKSMAAAMWWDFKPLWDYQLRMFRSRRRKTQMAHKH